MPTPSAQPNEKISPTRASSYEDRFSAATGQVMDLKPSEAPIDQVMDLKSSLTDVDQVIAPLPSTAEVAPQSSALTHFPSLLKLVLALTVCVLIYATFSSYRSMLASRERANASGQAVQVWWNNPMGAEANGNGSLMVRVRENMHAIAASTDVIGIPSISDSRLTLAFPSSIDEPTCMYSVWAMHSAAPLAKLSVSAVFTIPGSRTTSDLEALAIGDALNKKLNRPLTTSSEVIDMCKLTAGMERDVTIVRPSA